MSKIEKETENAMEAVAPVKKPRASKKKLETSTSDQVETAAKKPRATRKKVEVVSNPEENVILFSTLNESLSNKIVELANKAKVEVVFLESKLVTDYLSAKTNNNDTGRMTMEKFVNDLSNRRDAELKAMQLWAILTKGADSKLADKTEFTLKEVVDKTTLSHSKLKELLDLFKAFGIVSFTKGSHQFKLQFSKSRQHETIVKEIEAMAGVLSSDLARYKSSIENDDSLTKQQREDMMKMISNKLDELIEF